MSDFEKRIADLEDQQNEMYLDLHAASVAITILSTAFNATASEPGLLAKAYEDGVATHKANEIEPDADNDYMDKLNEKVLALLSKSS